MTFELQPTLTGATLALTPIRESDWDELFAVAADPELWAQHPSRDRFQEPVFRQFFADAISSGSAFVIRDRVSGVIIGSSRYNALDEQASEIEIGWTFIARKYWGSTANFETKTLMLDHAFQFVRTVVFWVGESNLRSRRAVEKLGAELRDETVHRANSPHVIYALQREQFKQSQHLTV